MLEHWNTNLGNPPLATSLRKARVALTPRWARLCTRLSNGALITGSNRAGYGGRGVYIWRDRLEPELAALSNFLKPGMTFMDIGANTGVFAMKAAKEVGESGLVLALEPFIETAEVLVHNIELNHFSNVRVRVCCAAARTGHVAFYLNRDRPASFGMRRIGDAKSISVLAVAIDDLCRWESLERLDYLKIDAEGAEEAILLGARESLRRFRPIVQVEITRADVAPIEGYHIFAAPGSPNKLLVPEERQEATAVARSLGWDEVTTQIKIPSEYRARAGPDCLVPHGGSASARVES